EILEDLESPGVNADRLGQRARRGRFVDHADLHATSHQLACHREPGRTGTNDENVDLHHAKSLHALRPGAALISTSCGRWGSSLARWSPRAAGSTTIRYRTRPGERAVVDPNSSMSPINVCVPPASVGFGSALPRPREALEILRGQLRRDLC